MCARAQRTAPPPRSRLLRLSLGLPRPHHPHRDGLRRHGGRGSRWWRERRRDGRLGGGRGGDAHHLGRVGAFGGRLLAVDGEGRRAAKLDLVWADEREHHGEEAEAVGGAKDADAEKLLEEDAEDVRLGGGEDEDRRERREGAVHDRGSHLAECVVGALLARALGDDEGVGDVGRIVYGEAEGEDEVDDGDRIDGEAPHVHEAEDVDVDHDDAGDDHGRGVDGSDDGGGDEEDREQCEGEVDERLLADYGKLLVEDVGIHERVRVHARADAGALHRRAQVAHARDLVVGLVKIRVDRLELCALQPLRHLRRREVADGIGHRPHKVGREALASRDVRDKLVKVGVEVGGRKVAVDERSIVRRGGAVGEHHGLDVRA
mmetsp:Transcript_56274/g.147796  ORF Transcript_56274/g.147796 Transcript_56274/m.147796 type:complete len:375 (+) Transcript_56274:450-1574(+)